MSTIETATAPTERVEFATLRATALRSTPTPSPFPAGSRYQIRQLTTSTEALWAAAIVAQSNIFSSPIWSAVYEPSAARFDRYLDAQFPLLDERFTPSWTLSLGVFDTDFEYSHHEARQIGGKFYWDDWPNEEAKKRELETMTRDDISKRMDFPLVSVALSFDGHDKTDIAKIVRLAEPLPDIFLLLGGLDKSDPRDNDGKSPKEPGRLLRRNATNTREGYAGKGLSKQLTYYLLDEARRQGFKAMQIDVTHNALAHMLLRVPSPCKSRVVAQLDMSKVEDENGRRPFSEVHDAVSRMVVDLV